MDDFLAVNPYHPYQRVSMVDCYKDAFADVESLTKVAFMVMLRQNVKEVDIGTVVGYRAPKVVHLQNLLGSYKEDRSLAVDFIRVASSLKEEAKSHKGYSIKVETEAIEFKLDPKCY
jgi:hypothetical protein